MILDKIIEHKKQEIAQAKLNIPEKVLKSKLAPPKGGRFIEVLTKPGISLIAEVKKASPSKGILQENFNPVKLAEMYKQAGATAISVLTENKFFQGSVEDLQQVKNAVDLPVLRKDFIIDPYQLYEASYIGADAVLLIATILDEQQLREYNRLAKRLGLDVLVEVHTQEELAKALNCGADIIGINNRDLTTFKTDIETTLQLANMVPENCLLVSESGISTGKEVGRLAQAGVDAILVGEALVTSLDVVEKIKGLLQGGSS